MASRRLPGQNRQNQPPAARRPPPPAEPAPLPGQIYFEEQSRKREQAAATPLPAPGPHVEEEPESIEDAESPVAMITRTYGTTTVAAVTLLVQFSLGIFMLPRIVNAAENLLVRPTQLIALLAMGVIELGLLAWGAWARAWYGIVGGAILALVWWFYLLVQIAL